MMKMHLGELKILILNKFSLDKWLINRKIRSWKRPMNIVVPNKWMYNCVKDSKVMSSF